MAISKQIPLEKLQAAAAMEACCGDTEAYLDASKIPQHMWQNAS